ncbi:hypothetical protein FQZ97_802660 [compost metagenome]
MGLPLLCVGISELAGGVIVASDFQRALARGQADGIGVRCLRNVHAIDGDTHDAQHCRDLHGSRDGVARGFRNLVRRVRNGRSRSGGHLEIGAHLVAVAIGAGNPDREVHRTGRNALRIGTGREERHLDAATCGDLDAIELGERGDTLSQHLLRDMDTASRRIHRYRNDLGLGAAPHRDVERARALDFRDIQLEVRKGLREIHAEALARIERGVADPERVSCV